MLSRKIILRNQPLPSNNTGVLNEQHGCVERTARTDTCTLTEKVKCDDCNILPTLNKKQLVNWAMHRQFRSSSKALLL